jgi:hypothetical protein
MPVLRRKRKRKKVPRIVFPLMKPRNTTRTARNSVVTSATAANATLVMSAIILTRPDLQLVTPSPVVHVDVLLVVVKPKHPDFASISVTTRSVSTETNADSSMVRMTNESACKLVHSVKLLGNVTNSVMKVTASSEIDADSLTKRAAMLRTQKRTLRRIINF